MTTYRLMMASRLKNIGGIDMKMDYTFETVLMQNKRYAEAIARGASAEEQKNLLTSARILFEKMVLDQGRAVEYNEYCIMKKAICGSVF